MRNSGRKQSLEVKKKVAAGISHIQSAAESCQQNTHRQPGDLQQTERETQVRENEWQREQTRQWGHDLMKCKHISFASCQHYREQATQRQGLMVKHNTAP